MEWEWLFDTGGGDLLYMDCVISLGCESCSVGGPTEFCLQEIARDKTEMGRTAKAGNISSVELTKWGSQISGNTNSAIEGHGPTAMAQCEFFLLSKVHQATHLKGLA